MQLTVPPFSVQYGECILCEWCSSEGSSGTRMWKRAAMFLHLYMHVYVLAPRCSEALTSATLVCAVVAAP